MRLGIYKQTKARLPRTRIQKLFELISEEEADPGSTASINIVFTTDEHLQELNSSYRGKDSPTDVLSFNIDDADEPDGTFGEIYISVATAEKQAEAYRAPLSEEFLRLCAHGMLHLFGYDHEKPDEANTMKIREDHFLDKLGEK